MTRPTLALTFLLSLAACGKPVASSAVTPSQRAPDDVYRCVLGSWKPLGFKRLMADDDELRTSARKENPTIHMSSTALRKTYDRLSVDVAAGAHGTELSITAVTETEYLAQNGTNVEVQKTSPEALRYVRDLQQRCGGTERVTPDSVPSVAQ